MNRKLTAETEDQKIYIRRLEEQLRNPTKNDE